MNELNFELRSQRIKFRARLYLGLQKILYPHNLVVIFLITVMFALLWNVRTDLLALIQAPAILQPIYYYTMSFTILIIFLALIIGYIQLLGNITARHVEACMIIAFEPRDLRKGHPILIRYKKDKDKNIIIREFISYIPRLRWEELQETIADSLSEHFVPPYITYGGRKRNKGNRIIIYTQPDRVPQKRGVLHDRDL